MEDTITIKNHVITTTISTKSLIEFTALMVAPIPTLAIQPIPSTKDKVNILAPINVRTTELVTTLTWVLTGEPRATAPAAQINGSATPMTRSIAKRMQSLTIIYARISRSATSIPLMARNKLSKIRRALTTKLVTNMI